MASRSPTSGSLDRSMASSATATDVGIATEGLQDWGVPPRAVARQQRPWRCNQDIKVIGQLPDAVARRAAGVTATGRGVPPPHPTQLHQRAVCAAWVQCLLPTTCRFASAPSIPPRRGVWQRPARRAAWPSDGMDVACDRLDSGLSSSQQCGAGTEGIDLGAGYITGKTAEELLAVAQQLRLGA